MADKNEKGTQKENIIYKIFITGCLAVLPLLLTLYILDFLYGLVTSNLLPLFSSIASKFGAQLSERVLGVFTLLFVVIFIFLVGLFMRVYIGKRLAKLIDVVITRIPLVKTIYSSIKQMFDSFGSSNNFEKVVLVKFPSSNLNSIGFVVRSSQRLFNEALGKESYNVFVPTAPNPTSGFVVIVPVAECIELDVGTNEAFRFVLSVGLLDAPKLAASFQPKKNNG
ncbi:DUF502 domain-containing protein [Deferribacterales bacterium RsTz2092]|nr:hypothetical protein AGMMS49941_02100 [Deferribacterales bacterium]